MGPGKRFAPAIAVVALILAVAAPSGLAATPTGEAAGRAGGGDARHGHPRAPARLRVLHASPDAAAVDVQVRPIPDGAWSTVATDIGFGEASRYVRLAPGTHDVQLLAAGTDDLVHVVADVVGDASSAQTVNLVGLAGPGAGQAGLRTLVLPDGTDAEPEAALADQTPVVDTDEVRSDAGPPPVHPRQDRRRCVPARPAAAVERKAADHQPRVLRHRVQQRRQLQERRLRRGYVYAASDEGWFRLTIADEPEDSYYESRRRIAELTQHAAGVAAAQYGRRGRAQRARGALQRRPPHQVADRVLPRALRRRREHVRLQLGPGDVAGVPLFLRNYDVVEPRIADIVAARGGDVTPPLTRRQAKALDAIYSVPARLRNGFRYDVGRGQGSEHEWPAAYAAHVGYLTDSIGEWDPTYDPDRDGQVSLDELKAWNPYHAPGKAQAEMRLLDLPATCAGRSSSARAAPTRSCRPGRPPHTRSWSRGPSAVTTRCAPTSSPGWVTAAARRRSSRPPSPKSRSGSPTARPAVPPAPCPTPSSGSNHCLTRRTPHGLAATRAAGPQRPVTSSTTSMLPRVAFEYGQRSCALATSASASSCESAGTRTSAAAHRLRHNGRCACDRCGPCRWRWPRPL